MIDRTNYVDLEFFYSDLGSIRKKVKFKKARESRLVRFARFFGLNRFVDHRWITICNTIYYPDQSPNFNDEHSMIKWLSLHLPYIAHEFVHVKQFERLGLLRFALFYFVFPFPVLFSGKWFLEREAFLRDIYYFGATEKEISEILWKDYFYPWPKGWMKKWLIENAHTGHIDNSRA